jgi:hypothetical protein
VASIERYPPLLLSKFRPRSRKFGGSPGRSLVTRAYVSKTIELMSNNPDTAEMGAKLGTALADKKLEYYVVTAKWSTRAPAGKTLEFGRGLVWRAQEAARVFQADLSQFVP